MKPLVVCIMDSAACMMRTRGTVLLSPEDMLLVAVVLLHCPKAEPGHMPAPCYDTNTPFYCTLECCFCYMLLYELLFDAAVGSGVVGLPVRWCSDGASRNAHIER